MPNISWDAAEYKENFSFVPAYGEAVIGLITKQPGSRVIDLGCGNGSLTAHLADRGYLATGIDDSEEMLRLALPFCKSIGLDRVLIACEPGNPASRRTILANGGVYECTVHEPGEDIDLERYWIAL